jgi:phosphatidate cytidylyltransferase
MTSVRPARRFDWSNLRQRAASATVLAPLALLAVWFGGWALLLLLSAAAAVLANEWASMSAREGSLKVALAITASIVAALCVSYLGHYRLAWLLVAAASVVCALVARGSAERPSDAAFGALYIGIPCIALSWLRDQAPQGRNWTFLLLAVTWSADIGAFAVGNVLKGPKLWPRFSPNKTWSGFFGGLVAAMLASVAVTLVSHIRMSVAAAALMGLVGGLATMGGDLVESIIKRRFGVKDSGDLIPGHGGLLDRVDGLMFAILAVVAARLIHLAGWAA